jgi:hypothetical protein
MKFDGNRAWNDAVRAVSANREVLLVLAGVFFFLPGLMAALFLSANQAEMAASVAAVMAAPKNPAALQQMMHAYGSVAPYVIAQLLIQSVGYMAMLALLTDQRRPTVAEAMAMGVRSMPALIGTILIVFLGYIIASLPLGLVVMACIAALGPQLGVAVGATIDIVVLFVVVARLSLTLPVIVIEGLHRPFAVLQRSVHITGHNTLRLLAFYILLAMAYIVITVALGAVLTLLSTVTGRGESFALISGAMSGLIGAATSIVLTAILAAVHGQLAGSAQGAIRETFL